MDNPIFREKRSSGQHLDKKVNSIITAILNDMIVHADNGTDEDVTLPELFDRIYNRVLELEKKCDNISFYQNLSSFPPIAEAKEEVIYIDKSTGCMYIFNKTKGEYVSFQISTPNYVSPDGMTMSQIIDESVSIIDGGDATST